MKNNKRIFAWQKVFLFLIAGTSISFAQDTLYTEQLVKMSIEELMNIEITTSGKTEQTVWEASSKVIVVTRHTIEERGYKDLVDVLRDLPFFQVQSEYGHWMKGGIVNLRGHRSGDSGNNKVMLLLDGTKISDEAEEGMFMGLNSIPLVNIKQVEIVYGPNSTLYGRDAYAGIINLVTKKDDDFLAGFDYGTFDTRRIYTGISHQFADDVWGNFSFSNYKSDEQDPTDKSVTYLNRTVFPDSPYTERFDRGTDNTYLNMNFGFHGLSLKYILYDIQASETYGSNPDFYVTEYSTITALKNQVLSAEYLHTFNEKFELKTSYSFKNHEMDPATANLYTQDLDRTRLFNFDDSISGSDPHYAYGGRKYYYFRTQAHNAGLQLKSRLSSNLMNISGMEFHFVNGIPIISEGKGGKPITEEYQKEPLEHEFTNKGFFTEFRYNLASNILFTFGGRYDVNSNYDNAFMPRAAFIANFGDHFFKLHYSEGYLAPSTTQMFFESLTTFSWIRPNNKLRPEKISSIEFDYSFAFDDAQLTANLFYNDLDDGILESVQTGDSSSIVIGENSYYVPILQSMNVANGYRYGFSFEFFKRMTHNLEIYMNYSLTQGKDNIQGRDLELEDNLISSHVLNGGVQYNYRTYYLNLGFNWYSKRRIHSFHSTTNYSFMLDENGYLDFDPVLLINLNLRAANIFDGLSINLHIKNLLNQEYYGQTINATWGSPKILQDLRRIEIGFQYGF
ncbi:MAG: TonB-dependent receptor [Bacteroidetes bacterium]|nr:TonB-dependent receptor [Bacteroidota bacterium]